MKHFFIYLLLLTLSLQTSQAQFNSSSFSVTKNDLTTNNYPADSTANALVIYEEGKSYIHEDTFKLITEIKRKVKIFNKQGFDNANVEVYLYIGKKSKEKIKNILGTTYNLIDGKTQIDLLSKDQIFHENHDSNNNIVKFTLPNIKEGSVITYSYKLESPYIFKYKEWYFQEDIPKIKSIYNTSIPANYDYNIKLVGVLKLNENDRTIKRGCIEALNGASADCTETKFVMKDIPAFIEEDYMTSKMNYISRIEYELNTIKKFDGSVDKITKTWKAADHELKSLTSIGKQLNKKTNLTSLVSGLDASEIPLNKAKKIYKFVQDKYTWNEKHRIFKDVYIKNLMQNGSGNATEINILLHNLLKENNLDVKPVLLSTRKNGLPTKLYPVISEFNYLIVELIIDNKYYYLDATDKYLNFGQLPFKCLNDTGRVLDFKNGSYWTSIKEEKASFSHHQVVLDITDNNQLQGIFSSRYSGFHALSKKKEYYPNPDSYLENMESHQTNIEIKDYENLSDNKNDEQFKETYNIVINNSLIEDKIYFDPFIYKFFKENPFKLQHRTYPIDFGYKDSYFYTFEVNLSDKYDIIEKPTDINLKLPNNAGAFILSSKINNNKLQLVFKINFNETMYPIEYYEYLKKFMSKIVEVQTNSLIVLQKK